MPKAIEGFVAHVMDAFSVVDGVSARAMFGGWGIYRNGVMIALIADDVLYMKVADSNRAQYEEAGMSPFVYDGGKKPVTMSYWELPDYLYDDPHTLKDWIEASYRVALAAKKPPKKKSITKVATL